MSNRKAPTNKPGGRLITGVNDASQGLLSPVDSHRGRAGQRGHGRRAHARERSRESRIRTVWPASDNGDGHAPGLRALGPTERHGRGRESTTVAAPRLSGPIRIRWSSPSSSRPGRRSKRAISIVEFDRQTQLAAALDRRAELNDLEQQIRKKDAGERAARARDDGEILLAESSLSRAKLETVKNELLPKIQAEKNDLAVEQATPPSIS